MMLFSSTEFKTKDSAELKEPLLSGSTPSREFESCCACAQLLGPLLPLEESERTRTAEQQAEGTEVYTLRIVGSHGAVFDPAATLHGLVMSRSPNLTPLSAG